MMEDFSQDDKPISHEVKTAFHKTPPPKASISWGWPVMMRSWLGVDFGLWIIDDASCLFRSEIVGAGLGIEVFLKASRARSSSTSKSKISSIIHFRGMSDSKRFCCS